MRLMTRCIATAAALSGVAAPALHAQAAVRPNFTGTWVFDAAKSQSSNTLPTAAQYTIVQHGDTVMADRETTFEAIGVLKSRLVVGVDGKPWKNTAPQPGIGDVETSSIASWDKAALVIVSTGNIQGTDFVQTDRWTLSADGKSLTSVRSVTVEGNELQSATFSFTKKN